MSGHSKWAKIKRQKGVNDVKRGAIFTKLGRNIIMAAKEGGGDPDTNFALRLAIDKAKAVNMPSENIDRSIKKGIGGDEKLSLQKMTYEAVASHGVNLLIECQTDNTNRTVSEVKKILENGGAKLASIGSVSWQFSEFGLIILKPARLKKSEKFGTDDSFEQENIETVEMELLEIEGIDDIFESETEDEHGETFKVLEVYTGKNNFSKVHKEIESRRLQIISFELVKQAKDPVTIDAETSAKIDRLTENLEDHDDVDAVWTNLK